MKQDSLRIRLTVWFGALALTGMLAVTVYVGTIATQDLGTLAGQRLSLSARSAAELLSANLQERQQEIALLAQSPLFTDGDLSGKDSGQALDLRKAAHSAYAWIGVADLSGTILQATDGMLVGQAAAARPWFKAGLEGSFFGDVHEAVLLAKLLPNATPGQPLRFVDFATPVRDRDGALRAVLAAHASWTWVTDIVASTLRDGLDRDGAEILIADNKGAILYPYHHIGEVSAPPPEYLRSHRTGSTGFSVIRWNDGEDYLTASAMVPLTVDAGLDWQIILRQPLREAHARVYALTLRLAGIGLLGAVVFGFTAYRVATRLSRPIEQLAAAVTTIEDEDRIPEFPQNSHSAEINHLSTAIHSMATSLLARERDLATLNNSLEMLVSQRTSALEAANRELHRLATQDALTGVSNRRNFDSVASDRLALSRRTGQPLSLILIDADRFKSVNDTYGHQTGDAVLQRLAALFQSAVRDTDIVARYGGEEFVILLPDTDLDTGALTVAEKIRQTVENATFPDVGTMTVSLGVASPRAEDSSIDAAVSRADAALYRAKHNGRNRVEKEL